MYKRQDPACDGSQDHDLFLKLSEKTVPVHIPKVLYYWRVHAASTSAGTAAKPYVAQAAKRAIAAHLKRIGARGTVTDGLFPSTYKVEYDIPGSPLVSILIPNKDHVEDLDKALRSIYEKTDYTHFEVLVTLAGLITTGDFWATVLFSTCLLYTSRCV